VWLRLLSAAIVAALVGAVIAAEGAHGAAGSRPLLKGLPTTAKRIFACQRQK
jgi:hypothetical protein